MEMELWNNFIAALVTFWADGRVLAILGLIVLDVVLGIAAAIRRGNFAWAEVGRFYYTMVLPYILGYLAFWLVSSVAFPEILGSSGYIVSEVTVSLAWAALVTCLGSSIIDNGKALGYKIGPTD